MEYNRHQNKSKFFVEKVREQKEDCPRPYDAVIFFENGSEKVGFVRDNFVCDVVDESGRQSSIRIPTSITYLRKGANEPWIKKLYGYREGVEEALNSENMTNHAVFDPVSGLSFLTMPLDDCTKIIPNKEILNLFLQTGPEKHTNSLNKLITEFKGVTFGLFGSRGVLGSTVLTEMSDIDLIIYGPQDLQRVINVIEEDIDLRKKIGLTSRSTDTIERYIVHYMKKFNVTDAVARTITLRRRRYMLEPNIKLSFNCTLSDKETDRKIPLVIGSRKIRDITIEGVVLDTSMSSTLPRVFSIETDGQKIDVITSEWTLKDFIRPEDRVKIIGTLRESEGVTFISLEKLNDIIIPITNGRK